MTRQELLNKIDELTLIWMDKRAKLDSYIQKWLNGEVLMNNEGVQQLVDTATQQIEELKTQATELQKQYTKMIENEANLRYGVINIRQTLEFTPSQLTITGGLLSSNANESSLTAEYKSPEELEDERTQLLAAIREKVSKKEITLAEASKLANDINTVYSSFSQNSKSK